MGSKKATKIVCSSIPPGPGKVAPRYYDVEPLPPWMRAFDGYPDARPQLMEAQALLRDALVLWDGTDIDAELAWRRKAKKFLKTDFQKIWEKK